MIVTRKTADRSTVDDVRRALGNAAPQVRVATAYLAPGELEEHGTGQTLPLRVLAGC